MSTVDGKAAAILWEPRPDARSTTAMGHLMTAIEDRSGERFGDYDELWSWSVANIPDFWDCLVDELGVRFHARGDVVLASHEMPGARWFPESTLNYAEHALAGPGSAVVLESHSQTRAAVELTRAELTEQVARVRARLMDLGVTPGDRVAAYMPNISETVVVFLAAVSLGAIFVSCAPEFGVASVVDRLVQVSPKVLFVVDGYRYGSKSVDRVDDVAAIRDALPTLETTVVVPYLDIARATSIPDALGWTWFLAADPREGYVPVDFDHPLYILFSSGSTGPPKPIVHGHGGVTIEHLKWLAVHTDIASGDVCFWPSSTAWMTWNISVSALLCGARAVLFDGDPTQPDLAAFWRFVGDRKVTHLGVSPPLLAETRRSGVVPAAVTDLTRVRVVSCGGSPLSEELSHWAYESVVGDFMLASVSGGTDTCTGFVGGCPLKAVRAGEITCRFLGTKVEAFDDEGRALVGAQGELVITEPMPSMPLGFWGDHDGSRLRAAYFDRFPGVWCHGDWLTITERGTAIITGRSDATLNRGAVRMGTQEFYSAIEDVAEISDSLVVHLEDPDGGMGELLMFVSLLSRTKLNAGLRDKIRDALRTRLSPRSVPDQIIEVSSIPRTITGKRLEVPVKRILTGSSFGPELRGSLADTGALDPFIRLAASRRATSAATSDRAPDEGSRAVTSTTSPTNSSV